MYEVVSTISDVVGLVGVSIILVAYFFNSTGHFASNSLSYQLMNFFGALLILFSLYFHWNLSSVVIEIAWMIISVIGMLRRPV